MTKATCRFDVRKVYFLHSLKAAVACLPIRAACRS